MIPTLTPAFVIPEGIGGGISGGGQNVAATAAGVVAVGVIAGGLAVVAAPIVAALAAKAALLTTAGGPGLLAIGAFLKALDQAREWGWLNWRPDSTERMPQPGEFISIGSSVNVTFKVTHDSRSYVHNRVNCTTGAALADSNPAPSLGVNANYSGIGFRLGVTTTVNTAQCGSGTRIDGTFPAWLIIVKADGTVQNVATGENGATLWSTSSSNIQGVIKSNIFATRNGVNYTGVTQEPGTFAPATRPQLFPQTLPDAPPLPAPPLREPLQTPTLPPPPDRRPLAPPVTIPRPGQQPARVPVPGPRPGPTPGPGPSPTPTQPAPTGVPAIGPLPLPIPLPVPTTPGSVVIVDGQPIGGPGQAPAPNLVAIATELGRLERKNEILLSRPENGGAGPLLDGAILNSLRTALERLITELLNDVPSGSFTLSHVCPPPGGGEPLPPVVVPYEGGANPTTGILAKMDGLAALIQAHKAMGQPTCKTAISGQEVTIHFESDS